MSAYAISEEQSRALRAAAGDFTILADARALILCDCAGCVLVCTDGIESADTESIGALAAGSFVATRELASILNEKAFQSIYHQGEETHIFVRSIADAFLAIVIFDKRTTVGLVKLYVGKMIEAMLPLFREISGQSIRSAACESVGFELDTAREPFCRQADAR